MSVSTQPANVCPCGRVPARANACFAQRNNPKHLPGRVAAMVRMLAWALLFPVMAGAAPDGAGQRAGEISRLIPSVKITRGAELLPASEKTPVYWEDLINTLSRGRARMLMEDGSTLNLGSDSNLRVRKHDAVAQQTELALGVGKMRTQVQKISQATGKFEVRTPAGVAGVVGTDFFVSYRKKTMTVIVFEGSVKLCNLAGKCVIITAHKMSEVCDCDLGGPTEPKDVPEKKIAAAIRSTDVEPEVYTKQMETADLGTISTSMSCTGNQEATGGPKVHSGDLLSAKTGAPLDVCLGTIGIELTDGSLAYVYRTTSGAIVELIRGTVLYNVTAVQQQNVTIVTSDVRITPVLCKSGSGTVTVEDPCHLALESRSGKLFLLAGKQSHLVEDGETYRFKPEYFVLVRKAISPDAKKYHDGHWHRSCSSGNPFDPTFTYIPGNNGPGMPASVPEPSSLLLLIIGGLALPALKRKFLKA